ncbi:hypothetical protein BDR07DRAFT_1501170 [Suillus spraguei]|nr:hypothetical protein BDR07DRAFT_1501170 [Suillus spraguei]
MYNERVRALKGSSMEERYRLSMALAPGLTELLGPAELVQKEVVRGQPGQLEPLIQSASDFSYSASRYGRPGFRVAAQAGVQELRSKAGSLRQKAKEDRASQAASTSQNRILDSLPQRRTSGRTYLEDLKENMEAAQAAQESSKDDLDQLEQQLQEKRQEIDEFRKKELEITQKLADKKKESAENERVLDHWRTEHDQLKLHEIDDDDEEEEDADKVAGASGSSEGAVVQRSSAGGQSACVPRGLDPQD